MPSVSTSSTRYPYEIVLPIEDTEGVMLETLAQHHVEVLQPVIPQSLRISDEDGVAFPVICLHLKKDLLRDRDIHLNAREERASDPEFVKSVEVIHAKYVIGCDGAWSWVRRQCSIPMEINTPGLTYGVLDFTPVTNFPTPRAKSIIQSPLVGAIGYIPRPKNTARVYTLLKRVGEYESDVAQVMKSEIPEIIWKGFLPYDMKVTNPTWGSTFSVVQRVAARFSHKRHVIIVGDACHTHSPNPGQGANISMLDAHNLAWKIALVLGGRCKPSLLDTYEEERRPWSIELIEFDQQVEKLFGSEGLSPAEYASIMERRNMFTTGIGVEYKSRLTVPGFQDIAPSLKIGQRVPPVDVLRYSDWHSFNLLDLLPYSAHFSIFIFPGDVTQAPVQERFLAFIAGLEETLKRGDGRMVEVSAVLKVGKEAWLEDMLGRCALLDTRVYIDDGIMAKSRQGEVYESLGISPATGSAALVRPDGHMSMLLPVDRGEVHKVGDFLASL
ncbi:Phenol hydroxylase [Sparassis crispa]|uniref:Phenol hydroxylase n=1 Tax=Sparassis crispa TaxID=139825 RepID=A0A401GPM6_9APHY|nr:Phenol hydroxylase [Sparassis crispa]GBE84191.1 Phenol hydroxylase [Sparassis crispa]